jgi:hypothetical protein
VLVATPDDEFDLPVRDADRECGGVAESGQQRGYGRNDHRDVLGDVGALGNVDLDLRECLA